MSLQPVTYRLKFDAHLAAESHKCYPLYDDEFGLVGGIMVDHLGYTAAIASTYVGFTEVTPTMFGAFTFGTPMYITPLSDKRAEPLGFVVSEAKINDLSQRAENVSVTLEE